MTGKMGSFSPANDGSDEVRNVYLVINDDVLTPRRVKELGPLAW